MYRNYLTRREEEILRAIIDEGGEHEAAQILGISQRTVRNMMYTARHRTGFDTTTQLAYALGARELDPAPIR